ncbi:MAG: DUF5670 family protein [Bacteroidia bacterium]
MKKIIVLYAFCIAALLSSCNHRSGITLEKRHYMKGFYSSRKGHNNSSAEGRTASTHQGKAPFDKSNTIAALPEVKPLSDPSVITETVKSETKNTVYASRAKASERTYFAPTSTRIKYSPLKLKHNTGKLSTALRNSDSDDALSLLWILILVLLAIWAIAFLTGGWGLGGFVHLILVIAAVLFILWLLKII